MRTIRLYYDAPIKTGSELTLTGPQAHYLGRVLRARSGDRVQLFNGSGEDYLAEVRQIDRRQVQLRVTAATEACAESPCRITLLQGLSRGEKMDLTIQKSVELGVHAIQPVVTARSVVRLDEQRAEKRLAHWHSVAVHAAQQCGRSQLTPVLAPLTLTEALHAAASQTLRLTAHPGAAQPLAAVLNRSAPAPTSLALLIGPEGGFEDEELDQAEQTSFLRVAAGPRILRTETAAISLLGLLQYCFGDWAQASD